MVDYNGLENRRAERHRRFESLSLCFKNFEPAEDQRVSCFSSPEVPFEVPFLFYISLTVGAALFPILQSSGDKFLHFFNFLLLKHINISKPTFS